MAMEPREFIESSIPLAPTETDHRWRETKLHGCETCDWHGGFECVNCGRVIDTHLDLALTAAVVHVGYLPEELDEDEDNT
jgi:hypothetical protein